MRAVAKEEATAHISRQAICLGEHYLKIFDLSSPAAISSLTLSHHMEWLC